MTAHVLHVGKDDCYRVAVLRSVGYRVRECASIPQLRAALEDGIEAEAVLVSEGHDPALHQAADIVGNKVPVVLFESASAITTVARCDLAVPSLTSPERWLKQLAQLLEWNRQVRALSRDLVQERHPLGTDPGTLRLEPWSGKEGPKRERPALAAFRGKTPGAL